MERKFGIRDKIGYMFGDFGNDFTFIFASSFLTELGRSRPSSIGG
ncbi:hypothetical protein [Enterococcus faecium]|nr:hypothetical protein [Enterococcus faecium]